MTLGGIRTNAGSNVKSTFAIYNLFFFAQINAFYLECPNGFYGDVPTFAPVVRTVSVIS